MAHLSGDERASIRLRSPSRDSSVTDDPKSMNDSVSTTSAKQNWSCKEAADDNPSISSIKGDSISATIADYNRKHRAQHSDNQSRASAKLANESELSPRHDDQSSKVNFYSTGGSTSGIVSNVNLMKPCDYVSVSSQANLDGFDVIEESCNVSSSESINRIAGSEGSPAKQVKSKHCQYSSQPSDSKNRSEYRPSLEDTLDIDDLPQEASVYQIEPIILQGNGNLTLFGLSNSFSSEFPSALIGRVSREEFDRTMRRINSLLRDQQSLSAKLLLFGGLCCCCSLGFSLVWPSIALKKRSKISIEKFLANENSRLYSKLGLNWKLAEQRCYSNHAFVEYVLMIEFTPKINLYLPD